MVHSAVYISQGKGKSLFRVSIPKKRNRHYVDFYFQEHLGTSETFALLRSGSYPKLQNVVQFLDTVKVDLGLPRLDLIEQELKAYLYDNYVKPFAGEIAGKLGLEKVIDRTKYACTTSGHLVQEHIHVNSLIHH